MPFLSLPKCLIRLSDVTKLNEAKITTSQKNLKQIAARFGRIISRKAQKRIKLIFNGKPWRPLFVYFRSFQSAYLVAEKTFRLYAGFELQLSTLKANTLTTRPPSQTKIINFYSVGT